MQKQASISEHHGDTPQSQAPVRSLLDLVDNSSTLTNKRARKQMQVQISLLTTAALDSRLRRGHYETPTKTERVFPASQTKPSLNCHNQTKGLQWPHRSSTCGINHSEIYVVLKLMLKRLHKRNGRGRVCKLGRTSNDESHSKI